MKRRDYEDEWSLVEVFLWHLEEVSENISMTLGEEKGSWNFSVDSSGSIESGMEECEVEKFLIGSIEWNEEEIFLEGEDQSFLATKEEVSFLFFSQDEIEAIGEWGYDWMDARKDLDPRFILKKYSMLIYFFLELNYFEE